jgi:hypothetical protein
MGDYTWTTARLSTNARCTSLAASSRVPSTPARCWDDISLSTSGSTLGLTALMALGRSVYKTAVSYPWLSVGGIRCTRPSVAASCPWAVGAVSLVNAWAPRGASASQRLKNLVARHR